MSDLRPIDQAAKEGDLTLLILLHKQNNRRNEFTTKTSALAAEGGNLDCLKYLHENGCPWDLDTPNMAGLNGHLDCLKYAHENGCPWNSSTTAHISNRGQFECLRYAYENGCPWEQSVTWNAAMVGNLELLKYTIENGCPMNSYTSSRAACYGNLECLQYIYKNGCEWTFTTPMLAARNGHLDCLKFAHQNGCVWTVHTIYEAAINGRLDCLQYAFENGCPIKEYNFKTIIYRRETYKDEDLINDLNRFSKNINFDIYFSLRKLLPYIDSELMNENLNKELNDVCKKKLVEIESQKEESLILSNKLGLDVVKHCLHQYL